MNTVETQTRIERSKYAFSSSSKAKAWNLHIDGKLLSFRTQKEAKAAKELSLLVNNVMDFTGDIQLHDFDGAFYIGERRVVAIDCGNWIIESEHKFIEAPERVDAVELLERVKFAQNL